MSQTRKPQPKYRHVAPALALVTTVVVPMAGITVARLTRIPAETPWVGVRHAEAASDVYAQRAAHDNAGRSVRVVAARTSPASVAVAAPTQVADPAPVKVRQDSPTLPLSPVTLMVGLAAARSRTLASASPRPAAAECDGPATENFDADIVGMTGVPGRKMHYGRTNKNTPGSACRRRAQAANATP